jgi:hypothetical protein
MHDKIDAITILQLPPLGLDRRLAAVADAPLGMVYQYASSDSVSPIP